MVPNAIEEEERPRPRIEGASSRGFANNQRLSWSSSKTAKKKFLACHFMVIPFFVYGVEVRGELTPDYSQPRGLGIFGVSPGFNFSLYRIYKSDVKLL